MNPAMLEASDDLTNLSHLNEPAGMQNTLQTGRILGDMLTEYSAPSYQAALSAEGNLHIFWYCVNSDESVRARRLALCTGHGAGLCREAEVLWRAPSVCHC